MFQKYTKYILYIGHKKRNVEKFLINIKLNHKLTFTTKHSMGVQKCRNLIKSVSCVNVIVMLITLKIIFNIKTKHRQKVWLK